MCHLDPVSHLWLLYRCKVLQEGDCSWGCRSVELEAPSPSIPPAQACVGALCLSPASPRGSPDDSDAPLSHHPSPGRG